VNSHTTNTYKKDVAKDESKWLFRPKSKPKLNDSPVVVVVNNNRKKITTTGRTSFKGHRPEILQQSGCLD
jgi:hypothetical protein